MDLGIDALKNNEEEIVCRFSGDPKDFIRKCTEIGIYSREIGDSIKKSFEALDLDSNVPRDVSIRYLLVHAYDGLQGNQRLFQPFLKVLAKYGVPDHVLLLCKACATQRSSSPVSMETMSLADGVGDVLSTCGTGAKLPRDRKNHFLERHIPALTEILAGQSSNWQNIGLSLNLPKNFLKDISALFYAGRDSRMCLSDLLEQWIAQTYEHAKSPTVDNLKNALRSETVGLGSVANQLDDELIKIGISFDEEDTSPLVKRHTIGPTSESLQSQTVDLTRVSSQKHCINDEEPSSLAKRPRLDAPLLYIVSQSLDTSVQEDKSTLLEVQVEARHGTTISYQWLKDNLPLEEGENFIGINKPILSLNNGYIAKGAYVCKIMSKDDRIPASHVYSERINVSVTVSPLKKVLVERYCAQPEIPEDSWPPRGGNTYINLALIKQGSIEKAGEYARNTIQGDMDDIFAKKDSIEYEDVFTNLENGTRLLIEGRPGSGKTTLVHKFSQDWGRGKLQLKNIKLVFLVHLRVFFNDSKIGLRDIVQNYYTQEGKHMVEQILECSVDYNGEGLCFILDGLDEYNPDSKGQTFLFKLIKKELLPKSIVIVASRPAATTKLRSVASRQVEVIGFLKQQIDDYIEKYSFSDFCKRQDLHKYLKQHPNVRHMCYLPIHAAMVCYLFDVMGSKLPRTETKMYTEFANHTLLRNLTRYEKELDYDLESPDDLQGRDKEIFDKICRLAFEKTAASRQVFKKKEIRNIFGDASSGSETMGLITIDQIASICGFKKLYTFLHLTFQEYLAAYYISKLEEDKQLEVINKYSQKKHMIVVWKFYCGLVNFNKQEQKLRKIMSLKDDLFNVHCAFESQQTVTCDSVVMTGESGTLSFNNHFLTPSDSTAIGYVVKNAKFLVEKVVLNRCKLSKEGTDALIDEAGDKISSLRAFSFHGKDYLMEQFKLLNTCLQSMESLEVLDISHTNLGPKKMKLLTENLTLPNLQTLKLSFSMLRNDLKSLVFGSPTFRQVILVDGDIYQHQNSIISCFGFSTFLSSCGSHIKFQDHHFKLSELEVLSNSIGQYSCCTNLCLTNCNISNNVGALKNLALLESFDVSVNGISDSGATALAQHFTKLQNLNMSFNHIGDSGAMALAESLHFLINLKKLDLSYNRIGDEGAIAITRAIKDFQDFELSLWNHRITKEGVCTVTDLKPDLELQVHVLNLMGMSVAMLDFLAANIDGDSEQLGRIQFINFKGLRKQKVFLQVLAILKEFVNLEEVNLEECDFVDSIKHYTELQNLDLEGSNIGATGAQTLANLVKHYPNLVTLNLCGNSIGPCGAKALADGFMHCTNLQVLNLSKNRICTGDTALADDLISPADVIKTLSDGLKNCTKLQTLNLNENSISNDGAKALAYGALKYCTNLQILSLESNNIGTDGAMAIADILNHLTILQMLNLGQNSVGTSGAKALASSLKHCTNLQTLDLNWNGIGADGAMALADSLKHCTNLQTLHLGHNGIGTDGAKALANCLKHCTNLQTLHLGHNKICGDGAKALADCFKHCTNLQTLHLDHNGISVDGAKALADCFKHCTNLQTLHLDNNKIGVDGAKALADVLKYCSNLQTLNLNMNGIGADGAKALKNCTILQTLHLDKNEIGTDGAKALADSLMCCTNLQTLHLGHNKISANGAKALADGLKHCTNLQTLHLGYNKIGADGAKALAYGIKHCTNLQTLLLDGNEIGTDGAKALADCIDHCTIMQALHLDYNKIGNDGAKALSDSLKNCTNLQTLHLNLNEIGVDGAKALADGLKHCTNLQTLHLDWNKSGADGAKALADGLKHCTNLQTLHLDHNKIGADGAKALADGLKHCTNLQTLHLGYNKIGADGAKALADGLKHCTNLQTLLLDGNEIGADGAKALADCIDHCTIMQALHLDYNKIGNDGAKALSDSLKNCTNLQTLHLNLNEIGVDGAKALADGLKHCTNLQTLHLDWNKSGADGAKALADGLKHCTNLQTLHLDHNKIGADGAKALADGLKHCTNLQTLHLDHNKIGADGAKALADGLKHCTNLQTLHLNWNNIGADGAKTLTDGIKHCTVSCRPF